MGYLLDLPGPKLYLRRVDDESEKDDEGMKHIRGERERLSIRSLKRKRRGPPLPP